MTPIPMLYVLIIFAVLLVIASLSGFLKYWCVLLASKLRSPQEGVYKDACRSLSESIEHAYKEHLYLDLPRVKYEIHAALTMVLVPKLFVGLLIHLVFTILYVIELINYENSYDPGTLYYTLFAYIVIIMLVILKIAFDVSQQFGGRLIMIHDHNLRRTLFIVDVLQMLETLIPSRSPFPKPKPRTAKYFKYEEMLYRILNDDDLLDDERYSLVGYIEFVIQTEIPDSEHKNWLLGGTDYVRSKIAEKFQCGDNNEE